MKYFNSKEELIKMVELIPDELVDEVGKILQQAIFREESWHEFFELVGIGESGLSDVSENKHKYLAGALKDER